MSLAWALFTGSSSAAESVSGKIDAERSRVFIFVGKTGLGHEHAVEGRIKEGRVALGAAGGGEIVFDMASFTADGDVARRRLGLSGTSSASTRQQVTNNMRGRDVLDVQRYPTAVFKITSVEPIEGAAAAAGEKRVRLRGTFTLHGVSRPLAIVASAAATSEGVRLHGEFSILQTEYGIKPFSIALGTMGVADKLTIHGDLWLDKSAIETK